MGVGEDDLVVLDRGVVVNWFCRCRIERHGAAGVKAVLGAAGVGDIETGEGRAGLRILLGLGKLEPIRAGGYGVVFRTIDKPADNVAAAA